ncbi:uncharacterized protein [Dermacentor albipictus]|uniref:uncharacterized protein isoform X1 n=1 Tax=Dermacentor albipictus TaxID=60249 RepID=UPI0031FBC7C8
MRAATDIMLSCKDYIMKLDLSPLILKLPASASGIAANWTNFIFHAGAPTAVHRNSDLLRSCELPQQHHLSTAEIVLGLHGEIVPYIGSHESGTARQAETERDHPRESRNNMRIQLYSS